MNKTALNLHHVECGWSYCGKLLAFVVALQEWVPFPSVKAAEKVCAEPFATVWEQEALFVVEAQIIEHVFTMQSSSFATLAVYLYVTVAETVAVGVEAVPAEMVLYAAVGT